MTDRIKHIDQMEMRCRQWSGADPDFKKVLHLDHIAGKENPSDLLTKVYTLVVLEHLRGQIYG